jgi:threonine 3-dehydrogenase
MSNKTETTDSSIQTETILVTGANGEVGHGLIPELAKKGHSIIALDANDLDQTLMPSVKEFIKASVTQKDVVRLLIKENKVTTIFHLAAILSTSAEKDPVKAQEVNAGGSASVLEAANSVATEEDRVIKFLFPSTIAVYGLPDIDIKNNSEKVTENHFLNPITIYGVTKLYVEMLGSYYSKNFNLLSKDVKRNIDFRCIRFPGIISALTMPSGGTSDYAPEMIHSAAKGEGYESFVRKDTKIPFMVMPDAIKAILQLTNAAKDKLTTQVYNVGAFSITAEDIAQLINKVFPDSAVSYNPDENRQKIVDSWPSDVDDTLARADWDWQPDYDMSAAFEKYLIPEIQNKYK